MSPSAAPSPSVSVILPVHRDGQDLRACLAAIDRLDPAPDEVVVAVDGGAPALQELVGRHGDLVVAVVPQQGPAVARNEAARRATGEVLWFVDADVEVHTDGVARVRRTLVDRDVAGVIGSYDDAPPAPGLAARYKNLLNHHVHQHADSEAWTFWGACGAIRRDVFLDLGGFDGDTYPHPSIEDIELGYRVVEAGHRLRLDPGLQVTHHKAWTTPELVRTDVLRRALPWAELLLARGGFRDDLNVDVRGRATVAATGAAVVAALWPAALLPPGWSPAHRRVAAVGGALTVVALLDAPVLRTFARVGGPRFAAAAWPLHLLSHLYSGLAFGWALLRRASGRARVPDGPLLPLVPAGAAPAGAA